MVELLCMLAAAAALGVPSGFFIKVFASFSVFLVSFLKLFPDSGIWFCFGFGFLVLCAKLLHILALLRESGLLKEFLEN